MRILIADVPGSEALIASALSGKRHSIVHTVASALEALGAENYDALIVGLRLEGSRMLDLVRRARNQSKLRDLTIICAHAESFDIPPALLECARLAARVSGAADFLNLSDPVEGKAGAYRLRDLLGQAESPNLPTAETSSHELRAR